MGRQGLLQEVELCILPPAGDVMCALAHRKVVVLCEAARVPAVICEEELRALGLSSEAGKSETLPLGPNFGVDSLFR